MDYFIIIVVNIISQIIIFITLSRTENLVEKDFKDLTQKDISNVIGILLIYMLTPIVLNISAHQIIKIFSL